MNIINSYINPLWKLANDGGSSFSLSAERGNRDGEKEKKKAYFKKWHFASNEPEIYKRRRHVGGSNRGGDYCKRTWFIILKHQCYWICFNIKALFHHPSLMDIIDGSQWWWKPAPQLRIPLKRKLIVSLFLNLKHVMKYFCCFVNPLLPDGNFICHKKLTKIGRLWHGK